MSLKIGSRGAEVIALQQQLAQRGFSPGLIDGEFGLGTEAAVLAFQRSEGLLADGIAGPKTLAALELAVPSPEPSIIPQVSVGVVSHMFPFTPLGNIKLNLPFVLEALVDAQLDDTPMVLMALATIRAETESFMPIAERPSRFNTSPNGSPFDLYDHRRDLGNTGPEDGASFRGRGYVQLTGRANYERFGPIVGLGDRLALEPDLACDPSIAAALLAAFLKAKELSVRRALHEGDLRSARRDVNGGLHGLERFTNAFRTGERLLTRAPA